MEVAGGSPDEAAAEGNERGGLGQTRERRRPSGSGCMGEGIRLVGHHPVDWRRLEGER